MFLNLANINEDDDFFKCPILIISLDFIAQSRSYIGVMADQLIRNILIDNLSTDLINHDGQRRQVAYSRPSSHRRRAFETQTEIHEPKRVSRGSTS